MSDWQQIREISMSVQTMDLHMSGPDLRQTFHATCNLVNIARGRSQVVITPDAHISRVSGRVTILVSKPLMQVALKMPRPRFDEMTALARHSSARPMVMVLGVDQDLAVSVEGDLRINEETILGVTGFSLTIPFR
ncbi:hypothetical protein AB8880_08210 [Alphaproteobacteria bacterium LSUCC0684]